MDTYQESCSHENKNLSDKRGEKPHSTAGDSSLRRYHHHQQLQLSTASCHILWNQPFTSLSRWHNSPKATPVLSLSPNCHISKRLQHSSAAVKFFSSCHIVNICNQSSAAVKILSSCHILNICNNHQQLLRSSAAATF
jgi:hypothetical protein